MGKTPARPKPPQMPQVLYVVKGVGVDDAYFGHATFNGEDDFHDGDRVAVYDLREVRTMRVTRGLR